MFPKKNLSFKVKSQFLEKKKCFVKRKICSKIHQMWQFFGALGARMVAFGHIYSRGADNEMSFGMKNPSVFS